MTVASRCQHPNGTKFMAVLDYDAKYSSIVGWVAVRKKDGARGVIIEYPDGKTVFKTNKDYAHIQPLELGPNDIF
jgi:hypothetical protein